MSVSSCAYHTVSPIYISTKNNIIVILVHIIIMGVPILKRVPFPRPRSWSDRTRICTTYTVSSRANNYRISMEKDTDTRTDCIRDWDCCIHSIFFYRIDGILRDRGRSLRYLGTVFGGLRSGCLPLVVGILCGDMSISIHTLDLN